MYYRRALKLQAFLDMATENGDVHSLNTFQENNTFWCFNVVICRHNH